MPRTRRLAVGGVCYHVLCRGNARQTVFPGERDYEEFIRLLAEHVEAGGMRLLAWCLMPNHVHLALWPREEGELGRFMQRLLTAHVRRHHKRHGGSGHLWQGRYKAFPVQEDRHLLTVLRYVERNPVRAGLAASATDWRWSSHRARLGLAGGPALAASPTPLPDGWGGFVDAAQTAAELEQLRLSANRGRPFGEAAWAAQTAARLGLEGAFRPRGRPRKAEA
jgi:putative transposase